MTKKRNDEAHVDLDEILRADPLVDHVMSCDVIDRLGDLVAGRRNEHRATEKVAAFIGRREYRIRQRISIGELNSFQKSEGGPRGRLLIPRVELEKLVGTGQGAQVPGVALDAPVTGEGV